MSSLNYKITDYSLNQGRNFKSLNNNYINIIGKKRLDLIEDTTMSGLTSLYEGMETMDGELTQKDETEVNRLRSLEEEFNLTLQEYKNSYKSYLEEIANETDEFGKYKSMNVFDGNKKKYYVNQYGYTRGFPSDNHWYKKDKSCPAIQPRDDSVNIYNTLSHGRDYEVGQPCNLDGKNIRNTRTGHLAWVDETGVKHFYPNQTIYDSVKKNGCPSTEIKVSNEVYNMFPSGADMAMDTQCFTGKNKSSFLTNNIISLNSRLMAIAHEMNTLIDDLESKEVIVDNKAQKQKTQLLTEITNLESEKNKLQTLQNTVNKLTGELEQTQIMTNSEYLHYIIWTVGAVSLAIMAARHISS